MKKKTRSSKTGRGHGGAIGHRSVDCRHLCSQLERTAARMTSAVGRFAAPFLRPGEQSFEMKPWLLFLVHVLRTLLDRLIEAHGELQTALAEATVARARRERLVNDVQGWLAPLRLLEVSDDEPLVPPGRIPKAPDQLVCTARIISRGLGSAGLRAPVGVELLPDLQGNFDTSVEALQGSIAAVCEAQARVGRARSLRDEAMDEYDAHAHIVRRFADASEGLTSVPPGTL